MPDVCAQNVLAVRRIFKDMNYRETQIYPV